MSSSGNGLVMTIDVLRTSAVEAPGYSSGSHVRNRIPPKFANDHTRADQITRSAAEKADICSVLLQKEMFRRSNCDLPGAEPRSGPFRSHPAQQLLLRGPLSDAGNA